MDRIPVAGPWITQKEIDYVADAAANNWYERANDYTARFEKSFAEYVGVKYAVSLPSCTSAIHLSLAALGIGPGDEVIVPDITWIATAAPISYVGATAVFADIDEETWCLSPESFETYIGPKTKAVIPVDLYGNMPDMDGLRSIAARHGIVVIEDAAEAIGSEYRGKRAGSLGDIGVFSFHGSKTLTTGEGGMLTTDREDIFKRVMVLRDHGRSPGDIHFLNREVGYKYKMSSMQAALGLAQLERIEELVKKKRDIFGWYRDELGGSRDIALNPEPPDTKNSYWMSTIVWKPDKGIDKFEVMERLGKQGVHTRPFFSPLSTLAAYEESAQARKARRKNLVGARVGPYGINLPSALLLTRQQVKDVCRKVRDVLEIA